MPEPTKTKIFTYSRQLHGGIQAEWATDAVSLRADARQDSEQPHRQWVCRMEDRQNLASGLTQAGSVGLQEETARN